MIYTAPERACGKAQLLTLLSKLTPRATQLSGSSPSVLFRMIEKYQPTLFVDKIETALKGNEDLRGLLNDGHTQNSAFVWRMKATAGINIISLARL